MEIAKMSTKGQIVIPKEIRKDFKEGDAFIVTRIKNIIVLKSLEDIEEKELKEIWEQIDAGKAENNSEEDFFKKMKQW